MNGGTLNLNGSVIGDAAIASGGVLSGQATVGGSLTNAGTLHIDINSGGASLITATGTAALGGTLEVGIAPRTLSGTFTVLTASAITGTFSQVRFTQTIPVQYTVSYLPAGAPTRVELNFLTSDANVVGSGTIAGASGPISFNVKGAYNSSNQIVANLFYNDPGAKLHFDNPVVTSLSFNGNVVTLGGTTKVNGRQVGFTAILTSGTPGSFSLSLNNGYSASGNLTSGGISIQ